jgi:nucleotide-binding universal stress UspA family protein
MMKKNIVVPIDFTPVSHEALLYACEFSVNRNTEIVAVHVVDTKFLEDFRNDDSDEVRGMADRMEAELFQKTKNDLDNFVEGLSAFYGDILRPVFTKGTIFEAFNEVALQYNSPLIVMGTHGIIGMQHVFGSKAYRVVLNTPFPFLVVQERSFKAINTMYLVMKTKEQFVAYAAYLRAFADYFDGIFMVNILSGENIHTEDFPEILHDITNRFQFLTESLHPEDIVERAHTAGAEAIGICIDEADNASDEILGITQDKVLANQYKLPVLCLPRL